MIRSVGAGSAGLNNNPQRRTQREPNVAFPNISGLPLDGQKETKSAQKQLMVGVKPKAHLTSIFDEKDGVVRLNADGDRLEVSKRAIAIAREKLL
ncbi:MAG: DNA primase [Solibacillus sp.]